MALTNESIVCPWQSAHREAHRVLDGHLQIGAGAEPGHHVLDKHSTNWAPSTASAFVNLEEVFLFSLSYGWFSCSELWNLEPIALVQILLLFTSLFWNSLNM